MALIKPLKAMSGCPGSKKISFTFWNLIQMTAAAYLKPAVLIAEIRKLTAILSRASLSNLNTAPLQISICPGRPGGSLVEPNLMLSAGQVGMILTLARSQPFSSIAWSSIAFSSVNAGNRS